MESEKFLGNRGENLKQREMYHCLRGDGRPWGNVSLPQGGWTPLGKCIIASGGMDAPAAVRGALIQQLLNWTSLVQSVKIDQLQSFLLQRIITKL